MAAQVNVYDGRSIDLYSLNSRTTPVQILNEGGKLQLLGAAGGDVLIGTPGAASNLVFEESASITGQGVNSISLGASGDVINLNVAGVTYNVGTLTGALTLTGDLTVSGNLVVNGTTTTINATTLSVDDKNIELGAVVTPSDATADGGGITLKGTTDKTITWDNTNDNWSFNQSVNLSTGLVYKINNASVLSSTTLGSSVVTSSLTTVGALSSGSIASGFGSINIGANTITSGLINGQTISSAANFTGTITAAGTYTGRDIAFSANNTYDIGTSANAAQDIYSYDYYVKNAIGFPAGGAFNTLTAQYRWGNSYGSASAGKWYKILTVVADAANEQYEAQFRIHLAEDSTNFAMLVGKVRMRANSPITSNYCEWFYNVLGMPTSYAKATFTDLLRVEKVVDDGATVQWEFFHYSPESWQSSDIEVNVAYTSATSTYYQVATEFTPGTGTNIPAIAHKTASLGTSTILHYDTTLLGVLDSTDGGGLRISTEYVSANNSSRIFHREDSAGNYGFSWVYAGNTNPTLDSTAFTLTANYYYLLRHESSGTGTEVLNVSRVTGDMTISANVGIGIAGSSNAALYVYRNATTGGWGSVTTTNAGITIQDSTSLMYLDGNTIYESGSTMNIGTISANDLVFGTNNTIRLTISSAGVFTLGSGASVAGMTLTGTIDYTPDTGVIMSLDGKTLLQRHTANGAVSFGADDMVIIGAGEARSTMVTNVPMGASEQLYLGAEGGVFIITSTDNWVAWANRKTWTFASAGDTTFPGSILLPDTYGIYNLASTAGMLIRTSGNLDFYNGSAVALSIATSGAATFTTNVTVGGHVLPTLTDTSDLGSPTALWRNSYISTMNALLFAENTIQVIGGWFYVAKGQGKLPAVASGATTIDFGQAMTPNDFIVIRAHDTGGAIKTEYIQVLTLVSGTNYNVGRDKASAHVTDPAWADGTPYVLLGNTGSGRIELNANDTPRIAMITQGATYNAQTELLRMGDLDGNWGYSGETYGFAVGEYGASKTNVTVDATNGFRIRNNTTTVGQWYANGDLMVGSASTNNVFITAAGVFQIRNATTVLADLNGSTLTLGQSGEARAVITNTALTLYDGGASPVARVALDTTGITLGSTAEGDYITMSSANGLQMYSNSAERIRLAANGSGWLANSNISWDTSGNLTIGASAYIGGSTNGWQISAGAITALGTGVFQTSASASTGVKINSTAISGYNGTVQTVNIATDGSGWFGLTGTRAIEWTTAGAVLIGDWTVNASSISATNITLTPGAANTAHILVGTGANAGGLNSANASGDIAIWAGSTHANRASAVFRVTAGGALTATSATITGAITASSGSVGSFTIGTYLYTGSKTAYNDANAGVHLGSDGIGIGNNVFTVSSAGALVATSATITGTINASAGYIGGSSSGWAIGTGLMTSGDTDSAGDSQQRILIKQAASTVGTNIYADSQTSMKGFSIQWHQTSNAGLMVFGELVVDTNGNPVISSTGYTAGWYGIQALQWNSTTPFFQLAFKATGTTFTTKHSIAGWNFDSAKLYNTRAHLNSSGYISFGATPPTSYGNNVGAWFGDTGSGAKLSLYASASSYMQWDGSALSVGGGTITGSTVQTDTTGQRIVIDGSTNVLSIYSAQGGSTATVEMYGESGGGSGEHGYYNTWNSLSASATIFPIYYRIKKFGGTYYNIMQIEGAEGLSTFGDITFGTANYKFDIGLNNKKMSFTNAGSEQFNIKIDDTTGGMMLSGPLTIVSATGLFISDTTLYRSTTTTLKTDDNFIVGNKLYINGGGESVIMNGATSNWIAWLANGVAAPALGASAYSAGTKLVLYPGRSSGQYGYTIGIEGNTMWFTSNANFYWYTPSSSGSKKMSLDTNGNLVTLANITANGTPSDRILKDNLVKIAEPVSILTAINGYSFTWNSKAAWSKVGKREVGLIAQEVQAVLPGAVAAAGDGILGLNYNSITGVLVEGFKNHEQRIKELEEELARLKAL